MNEDWKNFHNRRNKLTNKANRRSWGKRKIWRGGEEVHSWERLDPEGSMCWVVCWRWRCQSEVTLPDAFVKQRIKYILEKSEVRHSKTEREVGTIGSHFLFVFVDRSWASNQPHLWNIFSGLGRQGRCLVWGRLSTEDLREGYRAQAGARRGGVGRPEGAVGLPLSLWVRRTLCLSGPTPFPTLTCRMLTLLCFINPDPTGQAGLWPWTALCTYLQVFTS